MEIEITQIAGDQRKKKPSEDSELGFGRYFSDHFFHMTWTADHGWHRPTIEPYRPLQMDPAAMVFHYAQEIFEGLKAYRTRDGIYLFRSRDNWLRMNRSAKRLCMPELDVEFANMALKKLVAIDQEWVPRKRGTALYVRPTMIATEACVGVKVSSEYLFYIIVGPVGNYYPEGFNPIKIFVSDHYIRAARGGLGEAKTGANYAASLFPAMEAKKKGYGQVLWLDAKELKYIEEVGTMNIFFRFEDEVATSPLDGTILPGITRDSVLRLCRDWGLQASERKISIDEVIDGARTGRLKEVFGSGTAAVISPVGELHYKDADYRVGDSAVGELSRKLYDELLGIQYLERKDPYGWVEKVV